MLKNVLKFATIALLFVCVLMISLFGFKFADYDGNGILDQNAVVANRKFGNGTAIYLTFPESSQVTSSADNLNYTAKVLRERLLSREYDDASVEVVDEKIRIDVAQTQDIASLMDSVANVGEWNFTGSTMSETICDASMVESAKVVTSLTGAYQVEIKFTAEGLTAFKNNTKSYQTSSAYIYLMVDGAYTAAGEVPKTITDTYKFGSFDYNSANIITTIINSGELPAKMEIVSTEALAPTLSTPILAVIYAIPALLLVAGVAILIVKGKLSGLFASLSVLSTVAIFLAYLANTYYLLNFVTIITFTVMLVLTIIYELKALNAAKNGSANFKKFSLKGILPHGILFAVIMIGWLLIRGSLINAVMVALIMTVAHFASYFTFTYFGIKSLNAAKEK